MLDTVDLGDEIALLSARLNVATHRLLTCIRSLRRVACDAGVVAVAVDDQGSVLDIGRRTRAISTAIRRALWIRDKGCRFPGCSNDRFLHGHHVQHWLHGGSTSLDNLVLLCSFHHRQIHEGGFTLRLTATADVEVRTPGGACLPCHPTLPTLPMPPTLAGDDCLIDWRTSWWGDADGVDAWTGMPSWDGEAVDYEAAVGALVAA